MNVLRLTRSFGAFWWDFVVGETPELAVGTLAVVLLAWGLSHGPDQLVYVFPAAVMLVLAGSVWRGRRG
jgi:hypothetical protein